MTSLTEAPVTIPGAQGHTDGAGAFVPVQTRSERPWSYDAADFPVPAGFEVDWKHTPLDRLGALLGDEAGDPSAVAVFAELGGLEDAVLGIGQSPRGEVFRPGDRVAALTWASDERARFVRIPAGAELVEPVVLRLQGTAPGGLARQHLVIEAGANSRATVVLRHERSVQLSQNVEIIVRDGAALTVVSVQRWDDDAVHAASHQARVDRDGLLTHVVVSLGGALTRVNPSVDLAGAGSEARLWGLAFADAGQHLESQVYLHHHGPHTKGDVLYKSALQGDRARTVWIGDVLIGPDAVGTDSYEANRNLVLTDGARAESIPNLEIETGDILGAGHASATGRFDDEQLFYLQARGIGEAEARRLVVLGFLSEIVQRIGIRSLQDELTAALEQELRQGEDR